ncbi:alanine/ornithine racemase family PLP-dependent enzyme [Paenibacillus beijingensis]|uniref:Alanine racemase N-terminal domain-containing protein n=1 Tax=Paenibacillus beijingensis TaxID=1126833 RepID=A0A0D5NIN4_9BACL|nr:alanine/ornithine racemase family PLP-dependent enzyme [Paenibacillus beijingensis]AJY74847.1 hypothetical protein VN24_09910 [Paenibacillus beijingensis]
MTLHCSGLRLVIDLKKIGHNAKTIVELCSRYGINVVGVTKVVCAHPKIVHVLENSGIRKFADSRLKNIIHLRTAGFENEIALLRVPMKSEAVEAVHYADCSYQSELEVMDQFHWAAKKCNKIHNVILMMEAGDLREGILPRELDSFMEQILSYSHIRLQGLAINVGCYGGVRPSYQNTSLLVGWKEYIESKYQLDLPILSGGSSSTLQLLEEGKLPPEINELRIGEAIFLAGVSSGVCLAGGYRDAFELLAEIIEIREKPSVPTGEIDVDSFGRKPHFVNKGIRKRAILAIGRQDVSPYALAPRLQGMEILGASSDHMIVDITDVSIPLHVGDSVSFLPDYGGLLALMTSPYVIKDFLPF